MKIKILFKKWDTALIEFSDYLQANQAKVNLNGIEFFGNIIGVNKSKIGELTPDQKGVSNDKEPVWLYKDYTGSADHWYKVAYSKNF